MRRLDEKVAPNLADSGAEPRSSGDHPGGQAAVVVEHLTKRFGERVAFDDVSFEVGYGEVFAFSGRTGRGRPRR
jgi:ABC-type transporter Mla maintaining outer membrane lipid asymmetry ATPase subunit MlaF